MLVITNTRQAMYIEHNSEVHSCNHCYTGIRITYSESVFTASVIQHAKRMRHIVICGLPGHTIFFHTARFLGGKNKKLLNYVLIFPITFA